MVAVTEAIYVETQNPNVEVVRISVADHGDTYTSKKFDRIQAAILSPNEATAVTASWYVTFATNVATLGLIGDAATDTDCTLTLYGERV